jgi:alpha-ketoglutarate-dependent taurine dioxygenase
MWDNRGVLHPELCFYLSERGELRRATTEDVEQPLENAA